MSHNTLNLPPFWTLGFITLSWVLSRQLPILRFNHPAFPLLGIALIAFAITLIIWTALTLRRHQTTFIPHREANHLVTSGPFRYSRHPIYLADLIILAASSLLLGSLWPLLLTPALFFLLRQAFIIPEEKMLQTQFPQEFQTWSNQVRRWL